MAGPRCQLRPRDRAGDRAPGITEETSHFINLESSGSLSTVAIRHSLLKGNTVIFPTINLSKSRCHAGPSSDSHPLQEPEDTPRICWAVQ